MKDEFSVFLTADMDCAVEKIKNISQKRCIVISSGSEGEKFVPLIHNLNLVFKIYIFTSNTKPHEEWT